MDGLEAVGHARRPRHAQAAFTASCRTFVAEYESSVRGATISLAW